MNGLNSYSTHQGLAGTCVLLECFTHGDSTEIKKKKKSTSTKSSLKWLLDENNTGSNNFIFAINGTTALECFVVVVFAVFLYFLHLQAVPPTMPVNVHTGPLQKRLKFDC